ncbi:SpoIID/LytB domain-containing protein [Pantanalinema rosaneae CENA516]|uniref:SpoIID/LytB domain-containing protein n=1 Tax=Pantanalinema rosaneae TaxID=1620701 RepID=UPI003D6E5C16
MTLERFPNLVLTWLTILTRLGKQGWWVSALLWFMALPTTSWANPLPKASLELRVAIEEGVGEVNVGSSTKAVVRDSAGKPLGEIAAMNAFVAQANGGSVQLDRWRSPQVWIEPVDGGYVYIGNRWYRGRALVVPTSGGLTAVNYVDLEHYLYSVLGAEMGGSFPQEALKAQAVAARSYALFQRQKARNGVFDLGDTQAWQVYRGIQDESVGTQTAVNATAGQVLTHNNQIIEAVFHSSAGGCTENVEDVWMQPLPYLRSVKEGFTENSPVAQWTKNYSPSELSKLITGVGTIVAMQPAKTTQCGRIVSMLVEGDGGRRTVSGDTLRSALGLRSTLFEVLPQYGSSNKGKSSAITGFQVNGRGFGHGLGLSQYGARSLAQLGYNYQQIVLFYYKDTKLAQLQVQ